MKLNILFIVIAILISDLAVAQTIRKLVPKTARKGSLEKIEHGATVTFSSPIVLNGSATSLSLWGKIGPCRVAVNENENLIGRMHISTKAEWVFQRSTFALAQEDVLSLKSRNLDPEKEMTITCPKGTRIQDIKGMRVKNRPETVEIVNAVEGPIPILNPKNEDELVR